jgi:hypothetical protein
LQLLFLLFLPPLPNPVPLLSAYIAAATSSFFFTPCHFLPFRYAQILLIYSFSLSISISPSFSISISLSISISISISLLYACSAASAETPSWIL